MVNEQKTLSVAFYWHMHQPSYKLNQDSDYLLPWVRMHAVKDYLDMVLLMNEFPNLKLNFNLVPMLLQSITDYSEYGFQDVHSRLSTTPIENLSDDDKNFILSNFFDANFNSMISHHEGYKKLYEKRVNQNIYDINEYSEQEYSDIMAWFNLAWFDPVYGEIYPELQALADKGSGYTLEDRETIIKYQYEIIKQIIPTYRNFMEAGKIEITTSPMYHPILPILLDIKCAHRNIPNPEVLPSNLKMTKDAIAQTKMALDTMEKIFGKRPKGIWPPEQCVSAKTLEMLSDLGVEWTITDEGILANSINFDFVRDFKGHLADPYYLLKPYEYKTKGSKINVIFRDSMIPNLISFEYPNTDYKKAANDLYDRIKVIQSKIFASPDNSHLLTIALDGENSWESYTDDGSNFLREIYQLIENDNTLETVLISDYIEQDKNIKKLSKIYSGSWINRNFQLWIGEPTKNQAWNALKKVRDDFMKFVGINPNHENLEKARHEIYIAEGSDWFWWYGEPNHSGQDHIFDYLFREHLRNVYKLLDMEVPQFLNIPFAPSETASSLPTATITPVMDGQDKIDDEWLNAGIITLPEMLYEEDIKLFDKIKFGFDKDNLYLRFYIDEEAKENNTQAIRQMFIYLRNRSKLQNLSQIRLLSKTENIYQLMKEKFGVEIKLSFVNGMLRPLQFSKSMPNGLWCIQNNEQIKVAYDNVIDISIPFDAIDIAEDEMVEFFFAPADSGIMESAIPQELLLTMQRPKQQQD
ncbi:hypothetical protein IJ843_01110 [bacterium]|nr:hypothetical protein [bacterium]